MIVKTALFQCSSQKIGQCPKTDRPEFAFIGRSNVGKSSLINMLCNVKGLAKVSSAPGKTRLINHFLINDRWYLVDLPGYGYARVSKDKRREFSRIILDYVRQREMLYCLFVLVDARHEPQRIDLEFIRLLGTEGIPFGIVFTKADKLSSSKLESNLAVYKKRLSEEWEELPPLFVTSSERKTGRDEILDFVESCIR